MVKEKIHIPQYAKVKVYWSDRPENYSKEAKIKVRNHFANKYSLDKDNIKVVYQPIKFNEKGDIIEITGAGIENILDINYQRELMKECLKRDNKVVDFDRIVKLDEIINNELNIDLNDSQHRTWSIRWVMINNFLSFGEDNYFPFSKMKGLTVVNSNPSNQGGKTTLTIDALKFLLHGSTTKTDKNEEVFNTYSDKNELVVRGMIDIEGDEIIIERKMRRSAKKGGGWTVTNKVNYYKILPDGEEEALNDEDATKTTTKIKQTVGNEKDFELLVLATENNLDNLIGLSSTESGKILTRLIGLEVIEQKEAIVRKIYNEFDKKKKSNEFDVITLANDITEHTDNISFAETLEVQLNTKLEELKSEIISLNSENDRLLNSKQKVDATINSLNPSKLESEIKTISDSGVLLKEKVAELIQKIEALGEIDFDENRHYVVSNFISMGKSELAVKNAEVNRLNKTIKDLISGGICQSCNRKLDDVDNSEHILKHEKNIEELEKEIVEIKTSLDNSNIELDGLNETKKLIDAKNKLELDKDRTEVEIGALRNKVVSKMNDLKQYNLNLEAIEFNKKVDIDVSLVKTNIHVAEHAKDETVTKIQKVKFDISINRNSIDTKTQLIEIIKKEEDKDRIFKIYIDLVGKKGISKLVLRSVLPIINSELQRLLEDVCDFEVEVYMDDKNEVQFLIIKDGVTKLLKSGSGLEKTASSLALRGVLGKLSTLPMPNFITFDEVLGKVAADNLDKLKPLFDKIKDMYEIVFLITHNDVVKDWGDNVITVVKGKDNISKISFK